MASQSPKRLRCAIYTRKSTEEGLDLAFQQPRRAARGLRKLCPISMYGGLAAIWLVERNDDRYREADYAHARSGRTRRRLAQVSDTFLGPFGELRLIDRLSNGETIYERANFSS